MTPRSSVEIIAHRGYSARAPENTIAAMEMAIAAGADGLEWDVRLAACGTPMVFHDSGLERTTDGRGPLAGRTAAGLAALDAGSWFDPSFAGEPVPSLARMLDRLRRWDGRGYPELKEWGATEDLARMLELTIERGLLARTTFIAMDFLALRRIRELEPNIEVGYVVESPERLADASRHALETFPAFVDVDARILLDDPSQASALTATGVEVGVWTVDDPLAAERLWRMGVTRITTNEVERLLGWRDG